MPNGHLSTNQKEDLDPNPPPTPVAHLTGHRHRKKGIGIKTWLVVDSAGEAQLIDAGKHLINRQTGLSARDLRILDPSLSYPSTVTGRERALVIKLEHIKGMITAKDVWLLNSKDPAVVPFVEELKRRCSHHYQANAMKLDRTGGDEEQSEEALHQVFEATQENISHPRGVEHQHDRSETLPFEFVALEACLEAACSSLDDEAKAIEQEANPALDKLISKISTRNLERVRQIKARLVMLTGRVQKIKDEIEHLLENDGDMAEMYLTGKPLQGEKDESSSSSSSITVEEDELHELYEEERNYDGDDIIRADESANASGNSLNDDEMEEGIKDSNSHGGLSMSKRLDGSSKHLDVAELEMLLEAYFVQLDGTLNELSALREYIQDTEDYVNIMLDDKQNNLLQMGVVISTATLFITMFIIVTGIFGMNVRIALFHPPNPTINNFLWTAGGCTVGTIVLYVIAIAWYKKKRFI
ncbi:magnesium transporter MRS2-3-like [Rhodamnia argentea]|uniref:Magnesium transporter n=1 Tax=Rhodamnia argentea TaxID=178133 RepID=A0ABM3HEU1_9MYRT|nr:magnesium transporter MRS2-3-like [Rhodamnia argentea]